jgi:hypothetical protein
MKPWFIATEHDPTPAPVAPRAPDPGDGWPKAPKPVALPTPAWAPDHGTALAMGRSASTGARGALPPDPALPVVEWIGRVGADYSPAFVAAFCAEIEDGATLHSLSLRPEMPSRSMIRAWLREYSEFARAYAVAERQRATARVDVMDGVCQSVIGGTIDPDAARVVIAHYRWAASKEHASKYGDQIAVQPLPPPAMPAGRITLNPNDPKECERVIMSIFASLE